MAKWLSLSFLFLAAGCSEFKEPEAQDPSPVFGCYTSPDAPAFILGPDGFTITSTKEKIPFRYEFRKVGMIVRVPISAEFENRIYVFRHSSDHFYRAIFTDAGPMILMHFGAEAVRAEYRHQPTAACKK